MSNSSVLRLTVLAAAVGPLFSVHHALADEACRADFTPLTAATRPTPDGLMPITFRNLKVEHCSIDSRNDLDRTIEITISDDD